MILSLLRKDPDKSAAERLYSVIVDAARQPGFYATAGVSDTVEGRFEVLVLHVFLVLRRLKQEGEQSRVFAQRVFDAFFKNMDHSLRELGVGDLSVGRRIRHMAEGFYGRTGAYDQALTSGDRHALALALARNVFGENETTLAPGAIALRDYMVASDTVLKDQMVDKIKHGDVCFANLDALFMKENAPQNDEGNTK